MHVDVIIDKDCRYTKRAIAGFNKVIIGWLVCRGYLWIPG